ncbi:Ionotropic receptor 430 [Blattella germanica]|nr:Ionotropic receptor 430 [Blattella germanica]
MILRFLVNLLPVFHVTVSGLGHNILNTIDVEPPLLKSLAECVVKIATNYFRTDLPITILTPSKELGTILDILNVDMVLRSLNKQFSHSLVNLGSFVGKSAPKRLTNSVKPGSYIILPSGADDEAVTSLVLRMVGRILVDARNPSARLLIVLMNSSKSKQEQTSKAGRFLQMMWLNLNIPNAVVVIPYFSSEYSGNNHIYDFQIFNWNIHQQQDPCFRVLSHVNELDNWIWKDRRFVMDADLFPVKSITDMHGCILISILNVFFPYAFYVNFKQIRGALIQSLAMIEHALNVKIIYIEKTKKIPDFITPFLYTGVHGADECTVTYPHHIENIKLYVPAGSYVPRWKSLINIFTPLLWIFVVVTFVLGSFVFWLLLKNLNGNANYILVLMQILLTYLAVGITYRYRGTVATSLFIIWLFYCLLINAAYQSALIGFLANPGQYPPIRNVQELLDSNMELHSGFNVTSSAEEIASRFGEIKTCPSLYDCAWKITENRSTALLMNDFLGDILVRGTFSSDRKPKVVALDEHFFNCYLGVRLYRYGCLLHNRVDMLMNRLFSAGLTRKVLEDLTSLQKMHFNVLRMGSNFKLSLNHLQGAFYLFGFGMSFGLVLFTVEYIANQILNEIQAQKKD